MIQPISAAKLHNTQNIQALKGSQNTQQSQADTSATAPNKQDTTLGAMAANIKKVNAKNGGVVNFNGTKEELTTYLRYHVYSGDIDVEKGNYTKTFKTNDGTTYTITFEKANSNNSIKFGGGKKASMTVKDHSDNKTTDSSFTYDVEGFKSFPSETKKYAEMKKKYGEI